VGPLTTSNWTSMPGISGAIQLSDPCILRTNGQVLCWDHPSAPVPRRVPPGFREAPLPDQRRRSSMIT
jgi:hypothetical protein